jgi:hypothetical protein
MILLTKAELEEIDIRLSDTKKEQYEFKRDIVQQAVNDRTGNVMAERVVRYFEDKIRSKVFLMLNSGRNH